MVASIDFYAWVGEELKLDNLGAIGFFGPDGWRSPLLIGNWNETTYSTNPQGLTQGPQLPNVQYCGATSGNIEDVVLLLTEIPNYQATLNIRFTNDARVRIYNPRLRIYDNEDINTPPYGIDVKVAEIIHPNEEQDNIGRGDVEWVVPTGEAYMTLVQSPGPSSSYSSVGRASLATQHDWYLAISVSPQIAGSRVRSGLYFEVEYL